MLTIVVPETELFDDRSGKFIKIKETTLRLEHSLISVSAWESIWKRCFIEYPPKTRDENLSYIKCMCLNKDVNPLVFNGINNKHLEKIYKYINDPMTATTVKPPKKKKPGNREIMTSEVIYGRMAMFQIPFIPCEKWHLNRLIKLLEVCAVDNSSPEMMSQAEIMKQNREINAARRKARHSRG